MTCRRLKLRDRVIEGMTILGHRRERDIKSVGSKPTQIGKRYVMGRNFVAVQNSNISSKYKTKSKGDC
jgi:hypothetical protein